MNAREAVKAARQANLIDEAPEYVLTDGKGTFIVPSTALDDSRVWVFPDGRIEQRSTYDDEKKVAKMRYEDLDGQPYTW